MEEMRTHLAGCPRCAAEERRLTGLPSLLDRAGAEDQIPEFSPAVEDAVLDRFVRERAATPMPRRRRPVALAAAVAAAAAVVIALVLVFSGGGGEPAYARAELAGTRAGPGASGRAEVWQVPAGTRVALRASGLPSGRGGVYELWCVRPEGRWVSGGTFHARADGSAEAQLTAAVKPGEYHVIVVTRRSPGGGRGPAMLRGSLAY
jgi:hypothetical protein